jgi:PEP-CTERM motif
MISFDRRISTATRLQAFRRRLVSGLTLLALAVFMLSLMPPPAAAGLILQVENATAQAGGTGSFDVVLAATDGTFQVSGFSVELSVAAGSGVTFTGASVDTTTAPYVFTVLQEPPFTFATFPTTDFTVSDSSMTSPGYVTLMGPPTVTVGIEHVTFAVGSGTPDGAAAISVVAGDNTQILDVNADFLSFATTDGTITVSSIAVPEPSSAIMGFLGMVLVGGFVAMKRER